MRCGARGLSIHTRAIKHYDYARESLFEILFISVAIGVVSSANKFWADVRQSITVLCFPRYATGGGKWGGMREGIVARTARVCACVCLSACARGCVCLSIIRSSIIYVMRIGLASYGNGIKIEVRWSGRNRRISAAAGEAFAERASV